MLEYIEIRIQVITITKLNFHLILQRLKDNVIENWTLDIENILATQILFLFVLWITTLIDN